jgi:hypothetical protein
MAREQIITRRLHPFIFIHKIIITLCYGHLMSRARGASGGGERCAQVFGGEA